MRPFLALILLPLAAACSKPEGSTTTQPSAGSTAAGAKPTSTAFAAAKPAAPSGGKLVHTTIKKDDCTFDLDAPEALHETKKDGMSVTYEGKSIRFEGYAGSALEDFDNIASITKPADRVVYEKERNPRLVVGRSPTSSDPKNQVSGYGSENVDGRRDGCTFFCNGTTAMEGDVVAMCKSVKITFTGKK